MHIRQHTPSQDRLASGDCRPLARNSLLHAGTGHAIILGEFLKRLFRKIGGFNVNLQRNKPIVF
jgi:hypothetical protein